MKLGLEPGYLIQIWRAGQTSSEGLMVFHKEKNTRLGKLWIVGESRWVRVKDGYNFSPYM